MTGLRCGIVGCGAISEALYLPVLSSEKAIFAELHLLDTKPERLAAMAKQYNAVSQTIRLQELAAMSGVDYVIHCATGSDLDVFPEGTKNVLDAALAAGVKRVVPISSVSVYSGEPD